MLAAAVAAWSLAWIGFMLSVAETSQGVSLEVGYWSQAVSIGVVIIGTIVTVVLGRAEEQKRVATAT
jgi:hypothetical protein